MDSDLGQEAQRQRCPSLFLPHSSSSRLGKFRPTLLFLSLSPRFPSFHHPPSAFCRPSLYYTFSQPHLTLVTDTTKSAAGGFNGNQTLDCTRLPIGPPPAQSDDLLAPIRFHIKKNNTTKVDKASLCKNCIPPPPIPPQSAALYHLLRVNNTTPLGMCLRGPVGAVVKSERLEAEFLCAFCFGGVHGPLCVCAQM